MGPSIRSHTPYDLQYDVLNSAFGYCIFFSEYIWSMEYSYTKNAFAKIILEMFSL